MSGVALSAPLYRQVTIIGIGLIGSSLLRALKADPTLAGTVIASDRGAAVCARAVELGLADRVVQDAGEAVSGSDLVVLAAPVGAYADLAAAIAPHLAPGATLSDVGSVKQAVVRDVGPLVPDGVHFIPGHPIAGTEHSGPDAGFKELFQGRWCILTPPSGADTAVVDRLRHLWERFGSMVEIMEAGQHDRVLAITSHLPHLIAYTIVGTATDLEGDLQSDVIRFSASGFRDFTRIAASDPVMWRDVFLNNREAVLEIIQRFTEDLTALQRAIRWGEGDVLLDLFTRTRAIRRSIIDAKQA